jgi:peptidoglycan/xylan/chitin deacetylase (PgdA/CDA1 family)
VLAYHGVDDVPLWRDHYRLFVRPRDLVRQIDRLRGWGYELVTITELARRSPAERVNTAALTFDDGFVDNATHLVDVLRESGAVATVYVISGWLERSHPDAPWTRIMSRTELNALAGQGVEIGAHTVNHVNLRSLPYEAAVKEMKESKDQLEQITGRAVTSFAYPFGEANEHVLDACRTAGFTSAVRTRARGSWDRVLDLPRQDVGNRTTGLAFYLKRDDRYEKAAALVAPLLGTWPGRKSIRFIRLMRSLRAL